MITPEIHILKQKIRRLVESRNLSAAARAVESFSNRFTNLSHRIHQLPYTDRNAIKSVLYRELEKVLMRFEELEWLGPQSGPVLRTHEAIKAMQAFDVRSDRIDDRLDQLSVVHKLATAAILHGELEEVVKLFEEHEWLEKRRVNQHFTRPAQIRWN